jgi:type VI secretion system protein ImpC
LGLPRFLGRLPYGPESEPAKNFDYSENFYRDGKDYSLWVNSSFAFASNMVRCFENWGWSIKMGGFETGGKVENLPIVVLEEDGESRMKVPVEASVGEAKEYELCRLGFIPLTHWDRTDYACFFVAPSVV